uniref:RxLR effector candidate protein n=1 Tax=Hyaloperonospora arabidopsidis (strain Emoy2) TaxID=559515 RepID=M4C1J3_HYAAE
MAKRRHFGRFCLALVFNFPSFLYQPASPGTLVPLSGTDRQPHKWKLNPRGNMLSHWVSGHSSASHRRFSGSIRDHPAFTRIVQPWAGHQRWRPCRKAIKTSIFRGRHREGELQRDKHMTAKAHRVVSRGDDVIERTELRRFRAFSSQNWSIGDRSCPILECSPGTYAPASQVFWNCSAAQVHWRRLLDLWRCFGEFEDANIHVWVFAFRLSACPRADWAAAKTWLTANESTEVAQVSVFAAANELWRFVVASTTHSIWVERLCQMQDQTLLPEEHQARTVSSSRSALARFRRSTDPPNADDAERAQTRRWAPSPDDH